MNITQKQLEGVIILVVFTLFACFSAYFFSSSQSREYSIHYGDQNAGRLIVEVAADDPRINGVYFLPEKIKVSDAMKMAGITEIGTYEKRILDMPMSTGKTIEINSDGRLNLLEMKSSKKLILNIPININRATSLDLMMVPGIGDKTAERIVHFRREIGGFKRMEDLMKTRGIKEKKFEKLRQYFCIDC
jgi:competence ComEA-like helix-hairpin-helix protein